MVSRRTVIAGSAVFGGLIAIGGGAVALAANGVIPGKGVVDERLGFCDAPVPPVHAVPGPIVSGSFASSYRGTDVPYAIAYPPGYAEDSKLPVCLALHGYGSDASAIVNGGGGGYPTYLSAAVAAGAAPFALAAPSGGPGYWHPHPGDDPLGMIFHEFLPLLAARGLDTGRAAVLGYSMGGFGALLCGLTQPGRFTAVVASAPAFWRSFAEAQHVNPGAFASDADWHEYGDILSRAGDLDKLPVRISVGSSDPFEPAVSSLRSRLADPSVVSISKGCHDGRFWAHAAPGQISYIAASLARS